MKKYFPSNAVIFLGLLFASHFACLSASATDTTGKQNAAAVSQTLNISAFRDIAEFILETGKSQYGLDINITYVKDANEAHDSLKNGNADIVFMSYDDTLSIALIDKFSDIRAVMPIHGGILNLSGNLDLTQGKNRVGIDTDSGYARALKYYLRRRYPNDQDYNQLSYLPKGATNLRYQELLSKTIDATLLNPPFSYMPGVLTIVSMYNKIGPYQGIVGNVRNSWLAAPDNASRLNNFISTYYQIVRDMKNNPDATTKKLLSFYSDITPAMATAIYNRLWEPDGLSDNIIFNNAALGETEQLFYIDNNNNNKSIVVPDSRWWLSYATTDLIACVFNYIESTYPQDFRPAGNTSLSSSQSYIFRYYADTDSYLGVSALDNHGYIMQGSGGKPQDKGALSQWQTLAGCQ